MKLIELYLTRDNVQTAKDLQDWAKESEFDRNKVKTLNQQLVNDGFIKEKKKPTQFFYVALEADEVKGKVAGLIHQAQQAEVTKKKRLKTRLRVLENEQQMRQGYEEQVHELEAIRVLKEETDKAREKAEQSTDCIIQDLDHKVTVA